MNDILSPESTRVDVRVATKEQAFRYLSEVVAEHLPSTSAEEIYAGFCEREKLGSTGIGFGVAIPHCRVDPCDGARAALIKLAEPLEFDAVDGEPVDLICALVSPKQDAEQHLRVLGMVAERFNLASFREALRGASDPQSLYDAATGCDP